MHQSKQHAGLETLHPGGFSTGPLFRSFRLLTAFFICGLLIAGPIYGAGDAKRFADDDPGKPWHIEADEINYDDTARQYAAKGRVTITKGDKRLAADYVRFDHKTMNVHAEGHVIMTAGEDVITGHSMTMDLESETGVIYNGTVFIKENHFYIKGREIRKTGRHTFTVEKASVTTCDGDRPTWKVTGRNLKVTLEGYGVASHTTLRVKNVPVLYSPYLVFPAKRKRQSGFLFPQFGHSDRKGTQYFQPFFWAVNQSMDATLYEHYMSGRGNQFGLEYRYVLDSRSKGAMMVDLLKDRKIDDGTPDASKNWGYTHDTALRPNSDRYWLRAKHDQTLPLGFQAKLDIDVVSDQDYLLEFKEGYTGYDRTESYFYKHFGRTFDDYDDPVRVNRLNVSKGWTRFNLNSEARWYDDVVARRQKDTDDTLQRLPLVDLFALRQPFLSTPLYVDMGTRYDHLYRKDGPRGHRVDATPRIYLPLRVKEHVVFEPSVGFRGTAWQIEAYETPSVQGENGFHRELYDVKADLFSEIFDVYRFKNNYMRQMKHSLRPQVVYEYIPEKDQSRYPSFDEIDRIEKKNLLSYSITNTFISKSIPAGRTKESPSADKRPVTDAEKPERYEYRQFCRFKLQQSYDINEARENDPSKWSDPTRRKPFSPVYGELELHPAGVLSLQADGQWSPYGNTLQSHNAALTLTDDRGDSAFLEHRFVKDSSESIYTNLLVRLSDRTAAYGDYERNLHDDERIKLGIGLLVEFQCWSIDLHFTDEADDRRYAVKVNLQGLGGIGN